MPGFCDERIRPNGSRHVYHNRHCASDGSHYEKRGQGDPVCIDDEIPFDIPESWAWVRLGSIAGVLGGKRIPAGRKLSALPTSQKYIRVSDMQNGTVSVDSLQYVPEDIIPQIARYTISSDDVYITVAGTIGRVGTIPSELSGANLTENADKLVFRFINKQWLVAILNSAWVQKQIADCTTQVGQPKLAIKRIEEFLIPLAPLGEQQRIVDKTRLLMKHIENYTDPEESRERLDAELPDKLRKSILQLAVQGKLVPQDPSDEPASVLLDRIRAERSKLVKAGKLKAPKGGETVIYRSSDGGYYEKHGKGEPQPIEVPFDIPDSWEWARLGTIVLNRMQGKPMSDFCYIDIGSIDNSRQRLNDAETVLAAKDAPSRARKPVMVGDVLYSTVRPYLHNACIVDREFTYTPIASTGFAAMVCPSGFSESYLLRLLISPFFDTYANDNENAKGVAYPAINDARLYSALIPVPPSGEQSRIVTRIQELEEFIG